MHIVNILLDRNHGCHGNQTFENTGLVTEALEDFKSKKEGKDQESMVTLFILMNFSKSIDTISMGLFSCILRGDMPIFPNFNIYFCS